MRRRINLVIIISVLFVIFDYFAFQAVNIAFINYSSSFRQSITITYWSISGLTVLAMIIYYLGNTDKLPKKLKTYLMVGVAANLFSKLFVTLFLLTEDLQRGVKWAFYNIVNLFRDEPANAETLTDLSRSPLWSQVSLAAGSVPVIAISWGIISGAHDYRVRRKTITLPNLPKAFDGIKIGQLSDIHSGSFHNKIAVKGGVEMLNKEKPDVVFFTGDLVNNQAVEMKDYVNVFDKVDAPLGVYSIFGNHDYGDYVKWPSVAAKRQNLQDLKWIHKEMGWNLLINTNHILTQGGEQLAILGIENWGARGFSKYGKLDRAYSGTESIATKLLLSHDPSHWQAEVLKHYPDITLSFAGHTHGMQFGVEIGNIKWSPVKYMYKEWAGLYQHQHQYLYVNRGFGYLGYPGRIGIPPEITIIELKSGNSYNMMAG